jgi:tetratricopeptide (TPR) repeat protein
MSELTSPHLDDFTLLRFVAGDLGDAERKSTIRHLEACPACSCVEREIAQLDRELRDLARNEPPDRAERELRPGDPFRVRPSAAEPPSLRPPNAEELAARALEASDSAGMRFETILDACRDPRGLTNLLSGMALEDMSNRFAILYALQESGRRIAESPSRSLLLAEETLARLRREPFAGRFDAEHIVPRAAVRGQAHLLAGQGCIWAREFERARAHLTLAYRSFGRSGADPVALAMVEYHESQRRSFVGSGREALILARRAAATFEEFGLEDLLARARVAQGMAFFDLGKTEEALEAYEGALPVFERHALWSNYVGTLNNIGSVLAKLGRLDEARREYARALRRLSQDQHRAWVAFIRHGLADVLFSAGRFREAAISLSQASRLYVDSGMLARSLTASLFEVESWARHGDVARARHRLDLFLADVARHRALDASVVGEIEQALSGKHPDLERIADLRQRTEGMLLERLGSAPA